MKNKSFNLSELKENSINQLLDSQMLLVRGGTCSTYSSGSGKSNKKSKKSHTGKSNKKSKKSSSSYGGSSSCGCSTTGY